MVVILRFHCTYNHSHLEALRATLRYIAGLMRPAGRRLATPGVEIQHRAEMDRLRKQEQRRRETADKKEIVRLEREGVKNALLEQKEQRRIAKESKLIVQREIRAKEKETLKNLKLEEQKQRDELANPVEDTTFKNSKLIPNPQIFDT